MAQDLQSWPSTISGSLPASAIGSGRTSGMTPNRQFTQRTVRTHDSSRFLGSGRLTGKPHLTACCPTRVAIRPRSAGFGDRDRFHSSGKIGLHRAARFHRIGGRIIVHRECRQWQHSIATRQKCVAALSCPHHKSLDSYRVDSTAPQLEVSSFVLPSP